MRRLAALAAVPLLVAGLMAFTGGRASAAGQAPAGTATPDSTCILVIFCFPSTSSPGPSTPATASPSASASSPSKTAPAVPTPTAGATGTPGASASAGATLSGSPSATASLSPTSTPKQPRDATAAAGLVVSDVTWTMNVGTATMNGFVYKGNVSLPLAGGGTVQMMEFTVNSMTMSDAVTRITENGSTGTETDASFTASGVTMYATSLTGDIYGIPLPVTFTPSTALTQLLRVTNLLTGTVLPITMTSLTADQTVILAGQAQKTAIGVSD